MEAKNMNRRGFLRLAAGLAAGAALAACTPPTPQVIEKIVKETVIVAGTPQVVEKKVEVQVTKEVVKEVTKVVEKKVESPINLQFWHYPCGFPAEAPQNDVLKKWSDEYTAAHPTIKVDLQALGWDAIPKVQMATVSGNPPNLILRQSVDGIINSLLGGTALEFDLDEEMVKDLPKGYADAMKYKGKNYQVPFYTLANGMTVNLTLAKYFKAEDLLPKDEGKTWTFDQYLEFMKKTTGKGPNGKQVYGAYWMASQSNPFYYWPEQVMMWGWGADDVEYKDGKWRCKLEDENTVAFLKWWQECYTVHKICPNPTGAQRSRWEMWDQQELMTGIGPDISWARRAEVKIDQKTLVCTNTKLNYDWMFVSTPYRAPETHGYYWGGAKLDVNTMPFKTKYANETPVSVDFSKFLSNVAHQKELAKYLNPVRLSALAGVSDAMLNWHFTYWIPYGRQRAAADGGQSKGACESLQQVIERLFLPTPPKEALGDYCKTVMALAWAK